MPDNSEVRAPNLEALPEPFASETFDHHRTGIYDDPNSIVYLNQARDYAFLEPRAEIEYAHYQPRVQKLDLRNYKDTTNTFTLRFNKVESFIRNADTLLEVGAGNAGFLQLVHKRFTDLELACIEPDQKTAPFRQDKPWLIQYDDFAALKDRRFDIVCLFHVLEHILDPVPFLKSCAEAVAPGGRLIIEVPSIDDPLLSLYDVPSYRDFFFQKQHPFYYSWASLERLLTTCSFDIESMVPHQRYGMENHLNWLRHGVPGGNQAFKETFSGIDDAYRESLESRGKTDAIIAIVKC